MTEFLIALLANITIVGVVAAALVQYRQIDIHLGWLALLLILFLAYFLALFSAHPCCHCAAGSPICNGTGAAS